MMKWRQELRVGSLVGLALVAGACSPAPAPSMKPDPIAVEVPGQQTSGAEPVPIKAYQATVVAVGDCGVSVVRVATDYVDLDTAKEASPQSSLRWLREGQLAVLCGTLHRVLGLVFDEMPAPDSTGRAVLLDGNPAPTPQLQPGSVILTLDGIVRDVGPDKVVLKGLSLAMQAGRAMARFRVTARDGSEQGALGGAGDLVAIGATQHRIVAVEPADKATGIPGWVEIEGAPAM
jgi:hypothetical protein